LFEGLIEDLGKNDRNGCSFFFLPLTRSISDRSVSNRDEGYFCLCNFYL